MRNWCTEDYINFWKTISYVYIYIDKQYGFRKENSTIFSLIEITEKIKESINKNKFGCGIFIDLRKAFDTVNHNTLIRKLEHYGIRGSTLNWFKSYLNDKTTTGKLVN